MRSVDLGDRFMYDTMAFFGDVNLPWQLPPERQRDLVNHLLQGSVAFMNATVAWPREHGAITMYHAMQTFRWLDQHSTFRLVRTAEDLLRRRDDAVRVLANLQNAGWVTPDERQMTKELKTMWELGLRSMQIAYQEQNHYGCGFLGDGGLTDYGRLLIGKMEEVGIIVDLSHLNEETALGALPACKKTPFISHTPCRAVYDHPRGAADSVIRAVADRGGVVGIMAMTFFLHGSDDTDVPFVHHLRHAINVAGADHVCIGSDGPPVGFVDWADAERFFLQTQKYMDPDGLQRSRWPTHPRGLFKRPMAGPHQFTRCVLEAVDGNEDLADKILTNNARDFFMKALPAT